MLQTKSVVSLALAAILCLLAACAPTSPPETAEAALPAPPTAKVVPHELEKHGDVRVDNYYWLKEREDPEVVSYLEEENAYLDAVMKHTEPLQETLYEEIVSRIKKDDDTVPYRRDDYYYYMRVVEGGEYGLYCRKKGSLVPGDRARRSGRGRGTVLRESVQEGAWPLMVHCPNGLPFSDRSPLR